jgi:prepilin-type N-terminal cleavage/methylation domain-containing protein
MIRKFWKHSQRGLTIIELLVAISLFATVSLLALNVFVNITRMQGRIVLENAIYEDARFMMERMARAIRNNTLDYEEYFNKSIDQENQFGDLQGCYAAQFYNPGEGISISPFNDPTHLTDKPGELGALCNDDKVYNGQDCVVYKPSVDLNTGNFPYIGYSTAANSKTNTDKSNAFCPLIYGGTVVGCDGIENSYNLDQLYLIDKDGRSKTVFAQKKIKNLANGLIENALARMRIMMEFLKNGEIVVEMILFVAPKVSFVKIVD